MENDNYKQQCDEAEEILMLMRRFKDLISIYYSKGIDSNIAIKFSIFLFIESAILAGAHIDQMKSILDNAYETLKIGLNENGK